MNKSESTTLFSKDKPIMALASLNVVLASINIGFVLLRLQSSDFKVPVQYLVHDGSIIQQASWYTLYSLGLFSLLGVIVALILAHHLYRGNRIFSQAILLLQVVVSLVAFLTLNALLGLVSSV